MDYGCMTAKEINNEKYIKVLVTSSVGLQILLYLVAPWRKRSTSRSVQSLISIMFSLSNWIPAITLILITSCVVLSYDHGTAGCKTRLLTWASLMLLHIAGHGQERETPLSLHLSEIADESFKVIIEFLFYLVFFLIIAFSFNYKYWNKETSPLTLAFMFLACLKTFGKLKHLKDRCDEIKQKSRRIEIQSFPSETGQSMDLNAEGVALYARCFFKSSWELILGRSINLKNTTKTYLEFTSRNACKTVEAELELIYYNFYGGIVPSVIFLFIVFAFLCVDVTSSPFFITIIFQYECAIFFAIIRPKLRDPLPKVLEDIDFLSKATLLTLPVMLSMSVSYTSSLSLDFSAALFITNHLVTYPIMQTFYSHHIYRNDPHQWRRWSRTIQRFNMLTYSLRKPSKISASIHHMLNTWPLSGNEQYKDNMGEFIFSELRNIILCLTDEPHRIQNVTRQITAAKGLWVLSQDNQLDLVDYEAPFEERVLLWHMATGILYHTNTQDDNNDQSSFMSILLSDYMGYLLIVQPWIMSKQRGVVLRRCLEMWAEINELTRDNDIQDLERICQEIINQQQSSSQKAQTKTALQDAYVLAKKLLSKFPDTKQRWSFIVKVWVEKLAYAATRCDPFDHIQGLSQGGELASIIWLWMLHFKAMPESVIKWELHENETRYSINEASTPKPDKKKI